MSPQEAGYVGLIILVVLLFSRMWIGLAMALVGFLGYAYVSGIGDAFVKLGTVPYSSVAVYAVSCVPLFILMGVIVSNTGVSADLYNTAYKWLGQMRGGLAIASVAACGGFAAISGSSTAAVATMGKIVIPEMQKYNYDLRLASGVVAAGSTLGILIPPSLGFIMYGILTEQSIGRLFMAGIIPGALEVIFYIVTISIVCRLNPQMGPPGPKTTFKTKIASLKNTWHMAILFPLVLGGIYLGIFTPTEAAAIGAFAAIVITFFSRRLSFKIFLNSIGEAGLTTGMAMILIVGAFIFVRFMAITQLPFTLADTISQLGVSPYIILTAILVFYIIIGMFLDIMSSLVLTIPIFFPLIVALGFDPIWYGVLMVRIMEIGMITPPVGLNVYVLCGMTDIPLGTVFRGVLPFVVADILHVALLVAFPAISLFIPNMM
jgi:C4-dicarboxylate transporter DctM subunit